MTAVQPTADTPLLFERTAVGYNLVNVAADLAQIVTGDSGLRRLARASYAMLRGSIVPASVSDGDIELLFSKLKSWDDGRSLCEALPVIERLRMRMSEYVNSGGLRRGDPGEMAKASGKLTVAALCLAALRNAIGWRNEDLAAGPQPDVGM